MKKLLNYILISAALIIVSSCDNKMSQKQIAAQVGTSVLPVNEVRVMVPLGMTGEDSLEFVRNYIDAWIDEQMMYEQGLRNLPQLDQLNQQVEEYRRNLIIQNYENDLINSRMESVISEEESMEFYNKYQKQLRMEQPIIQGVFVKLLSNSSKIKEVKKWLEELNNGKTDCIEEFDQYGMHRAADYDNFFDTWVDLYRLTDKLPVTVVDAASFLKCKTYDLQDDDYHYLFVIKDYRLTGETQPYEFAKSDIYELLMQQRKKSERIKLLKEMKEDGLRTGFVKINN